MTIPTEEYNPGVPKPKDIFSTSQIPFLANFSQLYDIFSRNHVTLDAVSGAGNHTILEMLEQDKNNNPQTDVGEISAYSKDIDGQTDQIFLRFQGNQDEFQYTNYQIYPLKTSDGSVGFFTFLPNNILVLFGDINISSKPTKLTFLPPIVKNVIGMNFCKKGTSAGYSPTINLFGPPPYIQGMNLFPPSGSQGTGTFSYVILVNI